MCVLEGGTSCCNRVHKNTKTIDNVECTSIVNYVSNIYLYFSNVYDKILVDKREHHYIPP